MIWECQRIDSTMKPLLFIVSKGRRKVAVEVVAALRIFTGEHGKVCI